MATKLGLLGTLSTIAVGLSATAAFSADLSCDSQTHPHWRDRCSCEAVENARTVDELQQIIEELLLVDPSNTCIVQAAAKQALMTTTAQGPVTLN